MVIPIGMRYNAKSGEVTYEYGEIDPKNFYEFLFERFERINLSKPYTNEQ